MQAVPEARPVRSLPIINKGTLFAIAIILHPMTPGMAANFTVFSRPILSIIKPPEMAPSGDTITTTLATKPRVNWCYFVFFQKISLPIQELSLFVTEISLCANCGIKIPENANEIPTTM